MAQVNIQPSVLSNVSSGDSPALPRKRARIGAFLDDDFDASLDVPLDQRPAARMRNPRAAGIKMPKSHIQGLEEDEEPGTEQEYDEVKITEPTMRKRIEKHQSCMPLLLLTRAFFKHQIALSRLWRCS